MDALTQQSVPARPCSSLQFDCSHRRQQGQCCLIAQSGSGSSRVEARQAIGIAKERCCRWARRFGGDHRGVWLSGNGGDSWQTVASPLPKVYAVCFVWTVVSSRPRTTPRRRALLPELILSTSRTSLVGSDCSANGATRRLNIASSSSRRGWNPSSVACQHLLPIFTQDWIPAFAGMTF
jgi:hypothetical protein